MYIMATCNAFAGICSLVSGETEVTGTLVDLAELQLPSDKERLHKQLPGVSLRVANITTTYVLITSHSVLPGSTCLEQWRFSETFLGRQAAEKTLNEFVSGMISCCGPKSFVIPSGTVADEHHHKDCSLGLNFTMLFLNEDFQQHYCTHFGEKVKPPTMTFSECGPEINWIDRHISPADNNIPQVQQAQVVPFMVVSASSCSEVAIKSASDKREQFHPDIPLYREIIVFDRVRSVQCKSNESSPRPPFGEGMPLCTSVVTIMIL